MVFVPKVLSAGHNEDCFNRLFGQYLSYSAFELIEVAYIIFSLPLFNLLRRLIKQPGIYNL
jgi:hypothetical protein